MFTDVSKYIIFLAFLYSFLINLNDTYLIQHILNILLVKLNSFTRPSTSR